MNDGNVPYQEKWRESGEKEFRLDQDKGRMISIRKIQGYPWPASRIEYILVFETYVLDKLLESDQGLKVIVPK